MNRLSFTTLSCPAWDFDTIVNRASAMGYSGIEIRGIGAELDTAKLPCFLPENRERTNQLLKEKGLVICGIGTSASFHDEARVASAINEAKEALDIANAMGIKAIRVFGDSLAGPEPRGVIIDRVAAALKVLCHYAENTGEALVLQETHGDFNTVDVFEAVLARVASSPAYGYIWDIQHTWRAYGGEHLKVYPVIGRYVRHVHLKDCGKDIKTQPALLPGEGVLPVREAVALLEAKGYNGFYSFEWEKRWHPEIPGPEIALPAYVEDMKRIAEETEA
jgi:sugar phosphate isomerase/epimerase